MNMRIHDDVHIVIKHFTPRDSISTTQSRKMPFVFPPRTRVSQCSLESDDHVIAVREISKTEICTHINHVSPTNTGKFVLMRVGSGKCTNSGNLINSEKFSTASVLTEIYRIQQQE